MIKDLRIHDQILFLLGSTSVISGIFLTNIFRENAIFLVLFVLILSIQILYFFRSYIFYFFFFLVFFCVGGYLSLERNYEIQDIIKLFERETLFFTQEVPIRGTLTEKIAENNIGARYILRKISIGDAAFPKRAGILVTFPDSRGREIDQIISFTGKLSLPMNNEAFDYRTYLLLSDVFVTTKASFPDIVGLQKSSSVVLFIRSTREKLLSTIENIYPGESAKLLEGILIGERANLSGETKKSFNNVGLTHIIAVSGFNITIILIFLSFLFRSFPVFVRILLAIICVGFFTLLVGPQISVLRASVFGLISYTILLSGKKVRAFSLLIAVAVGFVVIDPLVLNYDVSFHLSFLAVFGLLFFGDFFNKIFGFLPRWFGLREALAMCFAAMVFTLPILMINFGQISLVSPLVNVAVVPLIPLVMLGGFLSMVVGLSFPYLGVLIGFPTWLGLSYILQMVAWFGRLSFSVLPVDF
jgi:competence protein ComEC